MRNHSMRGFTRLTFTLSLISLSARCFAAVLYVNAAAPGPVFDGSSWDRAFPSVQAAIDAAEPGDTVHVAAGTYNGRATMKPGVSLLGGYQGSMAEPERRDASAYPTVLDGRRSGPVVTIPEGCGRETVLDGFTITNGWNSYGGGLNVSSSATVSHNVIVGNACFRYNLASQGGGIRISAGAPLILGNVIANNSAEQGGGIACRSDAVIVGNRFYGNSAPKSVPLSDSGLGASVFCSGSAAISANVILGGGDGDAVYVAGGAPVLLRNTITGARGAGVYIARASAVKVIGNVIAANAIGVASSSATQVTGNTIAGNGTFGIRVLSGTLDAVNNIIAFNGTGMQGTTFSGTTRQNNLFGNDANGLFRGAYTSVDPGFVAREVGDFHLLPGSACRNAGTSEGVDLPDSDIDGEPRVQDGVVDLGADECDGSIRQPVMTVVRVSPAGDDANDGSSWATPKRTVQAALEALHRAGAGEAWVAQGTYTGTLQMEAFVSLYGGFAGDEMERAQRDPARRLTILDGGRNGPTVTMRGAKGAGVLDGFTIRNGNGLPDAKTSARYGGGVYVDAASPGISHNRIVDNTATLGGGIYAVNAAPLIRYNRIQDNRVAPTDYTSSGVSGFGGGVCLVDCGGALRNNLIVANGANRIPPDWRVSSYVPTAAAPALGVRRGGVTIMNNTFAANTSASASVRLIDHTGRFANNVVAFNDQGVYDGTSSGYAGPLGSRSRNCVVQNRVSDFDADSSWAMERTRVDADPALANVAYGDFRLTSLSGCIDAGDPEDVVPGDTDAGGGLRAAGDGVDIGAYEWNGEAAASAPLIVRVRPDGDDANSGASWAAAKATVRAAVDAVTMAGGGEAWMAGGTYPCNALTGSFVYLRGSFAGDDSRPMERAGNPTSVLDGGGAGPVITVRGGTGFATVEGFVVRNGAGGSGAGGIVVDNASPVVARNVVTSNVGGGIGLANSDATLFANWIAENSAAGARGAGVHISGGKPVLRSNLLTNNSSGSTGASLYSAAPIIVAVNNAVVNDKLAAPLGAAVKVAVTNESSIVANNLLAHGDVGIVMATQSTKLRNNLIFGFVTPATTIADPSGTNGNIAADPLLSADYRPLPGSPCVDAGNDADSPPGGLDLAGVLRRQGPHVDIGPYEFAVANLYTIADAAAALEMIGGQRAASAAETARLDAAPDSGTPQLDIRDAALIVRKAVGLDPNP